MKILGAIVFMFRRRRLLQLMFLWIPVINLLLAIVFRAPRVMIICDASVALSAIGLMVRIWLWPMAVAAVCGVAVAMYSAERADLGVFCLGTLDVVIAAACYGICVRWRKAYTWARALFASLSPTEAADAFHGLLKPGIGSYKDHLEALGVPWSVITCVEELCEERLTIEQLVDLKSKLERRYDDSS